MQQGRPTFFRFTSCILCHLYIRPAEEQRGQQTEAADMCIHAASMIGRGNELMSHD